MKLLRKMWHRKPDILRRAIPGRSGKEVSDLRAHFGHEITACVYFYDNRLALAAPITGTPGNVHCELRQPFVETEPASDERLGYLALQSLLSFESVPVPNLRDSKLTDWTTFKASGAPSVKAFNRVTVLVMLRTEHGGIHLHARSLLPRDSVFSVYAWAPISVVHSELGQAMRKLVKGANALVESGVV